MSTLLKCKCGAPFQSVREWRKHRDDHYIPLTPVNRILGLTQELADVHNLQALKNNLKHASWVLHMPVLEPYVETPQSVPVASVRGVVG